MVHETRSRAHAAAQEEGKAASKKLKAEKDQEKGQHVPSKNKKSVEGESPTNSKKHKAEKPEPNGKAAVSKEFTEFCKALGEHLSVEDMRKILQANVQDTSGSEDAVVSRCEDMIFYEPLENCPVCGGQVEFKSWKYSCTGAYTEWM
jgi:poly [ADP-ribose] polymerase